jgi:hypothetical protein
MNAQWPLAAVPFALLALLVTGCSSSSSDDPTPEPTPEPTTDPSPAPTPDPSPVPSATPTIAPSPTPSLAPIPTLSPTPSVVPSPTATATGTATATPTAAPSPTPTPDPDPGGGSASHCFNPTLFASGTVYTLGERTTDGDIVYESSTTVTVDGPFDFNGNVVTRLFGDVTGSAEGSGTFELFVTGENLQVSTYGASVVITEPLDLAGAYTLVNEPPELDRFDLLPGQSYSGEYRQTITRDTPLGPQVIGSTVEFQRTYVGRVSATVVPAGGFATCRFDQVETVTIDELTLQVGGQAVTLPAEVIVSSFSEWIGVNNGLLIRTVDDDGTITELVSATINGNVVIGY